MRRAAVDAEQLLKVGARLGDAVVDPSVWPEIMEGISSAASATGAALFQSDIRTPDVPRTRSIEEATKNYFAAGWHERDVRAERAVPLLLRGAKVVSDQDIVTPEEMKRLGYFQEGIVPFGLQWWAVIGFLSGNAHWGLAFQRTPREGPFEADDKCALAQLAQRLTETATLSNAVGKAVLSGIGNALNLIEKPALALDRMGFVLEANAAAEQIFDDNVRVCNRRLVVRDRRARSALDTLLDQMRTTPDTSALPASPIILARGAKRPLVVRVLPVDGAARSPFLGARALLIFSDLENKPAPQPAVLAHAFGLSPAEARLAALIATGMSLDRAAEELGIVRETTRTQLKAVFAKTATRRQGELVALLGRL